MRLCSLPETRGAKKHGVVLIQEQLDVSEQMQLMKSSSAAANIVKEVFVEGAPVKRLALLHAQSECRGPREGQQEPDRHNI